MPRFKSEIEKEVSEIVYKNIFNTMREIEKIYGISFGYYYDFTFQKKLQREIDKVILTIVRQIYNIDR